MSAKPARGFVGFGVCKEVHDNCWGLCMVFEGW